MFQTSLCWPFELPLPPSSGQPHLHKSNHSNPDKRRRKAGNYICRVMHAQVNSRKPDQKHHDSGEKPREKVKLCIPDPRGENRCQRSKKTETGEGVTAGKTERVWWKKIEEGNRTRAFEGEFQRRIKDGRPHHSYGQEPCFATPLPRQEPNKHQDSRGGEKESRTGE